MPLYSLQGATCDPGLIAHFEMPNRTDDDIKWLIVYVLLSRVRSLANLRSIGMTSKIRKIIEAGPPIMLAENFERLFRTKITNTKAAAVAAKCALGVAVTSETLLQRRPVMPQISSVGSHHAVTRLLPECRT